MRKRIGFSKTSFYWTSKGARKTCFTEETHVNDMFSLIYKCFMVIANFVFKQDIGIPMGIDPAPFSYIKQAILNESSKSYKYHWRSRFIDDLCATNDGNEFLTLFKDI